MVVDIYKMHAKEINIKSQVCRYYFNNLVKARKLETKNILINEKSYKDLVIYFTKYVRSKFDKKV